ncbi:hypothetical protein R6Q57_001775 [Mikania cordata]
MDNKQRALNHASSMGIAPASENPALLSAINFQASGSQHFLAPSSHSVLFETAFLSSGTSKALVTKEADSYDWSDQVQELEMTLSHAFMAEVDEKHTEYRSHNEDLINEVTKLKYFNSEFLKNEALFKKKLDVERRDISQLKELLSDKESNYRDARRRIDELSAKKEKIGLGFTAVTPPFNHNYSIMPNINISVDDMLMKSDRRCDFTTDSLNDTGPTEKNEERSDGKSTECSSSFRKSSFIPKIDFAGRFNEIKIKPNEMFKNFNSTFAKNVDVLESVSSSVKQVNRAHSTITKEAGSKLNPNCEPFVPTGSLDNALPSHPDIQLHSNG